MARARKNPFAIVRDTPRYVTRSPEGSKFWKYRGWDIETQEFGGKGNWSALITDPANASPLEEAEGGNEQAALKRAKMAVDYWEYGNRLSPGDDKELMRLLGVIYDAINTLYGASQFTFGPKRAPTRAQVARALEEDRALGAARQRKAMRYFATLPLQRRLDLIDEQIEMYRLEMQLHPNPGKKTMPWQILVANPAKKSRGRKGLPADVFEAAARNSDPENHNEAVWAWEDGARPTTKQGRAYMARFGYKDGKTGKTKTMAKKKTTKKTAKKKTAKKRGKKKTAKKTTKKKTAKKKTTKKRGKKKTAKKKTAKKKTTKKRGKKKTAKRSSAKKATTAIKTKRTRARKGVVGATTVAACKRSARELDDVLLETEAACINFARKQGRDLNEAKRHLTIGRARIKEGDSKIRKLQGEIRKLKKSDQPEVQDKLDSCKRKQKVLKDEVKSLTVAARRPAQAAKTVTKKKTKKKTAKKRAKKKTKKKTAKKKTKKRTSLSKPRMRAGKVPARRRAARKSESCPTGAVPNPGGPPVKCRARPTVSSMAACARAVGSWQARGGAPSWDGKKKSARSVCGPGAPTKRRVKTKGSARGSVATSKTGYGAGGYYGGKEKGKAKVKGVSEAERRTILAKYNRLAG